MGGQCRWTLRRQAPDLALRPQRVGRCAQREATQKGLGRAPGLGAIWRAAHGEVAIQPGPGLPGAGQLRIGQELQELLEADVWAGCRLKTRHGVIAHMTQPWRPGRAVMLLGHGGEAGKAFQRRAASGNKGGKARVIGREFGKSRRQHPALGGPDLRVIHQSAAAQRLEQRLLRRQRRPGAGAGGEGVEVDQHRLEKPPVGGLIGAGPVAVLRHQRMWWAEAEQPRALRRRLGRQHGQGGVIANALVAGVAQRIALRREAEARPLQRHEGARRCHDQRRGMPTGLQAMMPGGQGGYGLPAGLHLAAIGQRVPERLARCGNGMAAAILQHHLQPGRARGEFGPEQQHPRLPLGEGRMHRQGRRHGQGAERIARGVGAVVRYLQRRQHGAQRLGRHLGVAAGHVMPFGGDAGLAGQTQQRGVIEAAGGPGAGFRQQQSGAAGQVGGGRALCLRRRAIGQKPPGMAGAWLGQLQRQGRVAGIEGDGHAVLALAQQRHQGQALPIRCPTGRRCPGHIGQAARCLGRAREVAGGMQRGMRLPRPHQPAGELSQPGIARPIQPGERIVLTISIVVAALAAAQFIAHGQHGGATGGEQQEQQGAGILGPGREDAGVLARPLHPIVPGDFRCAPVAVLLAIGVVVPALMADKIGQGETVMRGDEIQAVAGRAAGEEIGAAGEAGGDIAQAPGIAAPEAPGIVTKAVIPFRPAGGEAAELVAIRADIPGLGDDQQAAQHRVLPYGQQQRRIGGEALGAAAQRGR